MPRAKLLTKHKRLWHRRGRRRVSGEKADAFGRFLENQYDRVFNDLFVSFPCGFPAENSQQREACQRVERQKSEALGTELQATDYEYRR